MHWESTHSTIESFIADYCTVLQVSGVVGRAELTSALCFMAALLAYTHCCAQGFARCIHLNVTIIHGYKIWLLSFFMGAIFFKNYVTILAG